MKMSDIKKIYGKSWRELGEIEQEEVKFEMQYRKIQVLQELVDAAKRIENRLNEIDGSLLMINDNLREHLAKNQP